MKHNKFSTLLDMRLTYIPLLFAGVCAGAV